MKTLLLIAFLTLLVALPATAQEAEGRLLFAGWVRESDLEAEVFVLDLATGEATNLTNSPGADYAPAASPDGSQIVFISERDEVDKGAYLGYGVYIMDADGANVSLVADDVMSDTTPRWSPDGAWIAYIAAPEESDAPTGLTCALYIVRPDGADFRQLTSLEYCAEASLRWSPDGASLVFSAHANIYTLNIESGLETHLLPEPDGEYAPSFSPDGSQIVFVTNRDDDDEIYTINADGSDPVRLTSQAGSDVGPRWMPDGAQIVYGADSENIGNLHIINADGSDNHALTDDELFKYSWVVSPDGSLIAFVGDQDNIGGGDALYLINLEGEYLGEPIYIESVDDIWDLSWWPV